MLRTVLLAPAAALALAFTVPAAANAETVLQVSDHFIDGEMVAWGSFKGEGEHFTACDRDADGFSAATVYTWKGAGRKYKLWASGNDNCEGFNGDITDGKWVHIRSCIGNRGSSGFVSCGSWRGATA